MHAQIEWYSHAQPKPHDVTRIHKPRVATHMPKSDATRGSGRK